MKKNKKTVSMSIYDRQTSNQKIFEPKRDLFLQSFIAVNKKYGDIPTKQILKSYQKQPKEDNSTNRISQLIYNQINIKKNHNHIVLPPLKITTILYEKGY